MTRKEAREWVVKYFFAYSFFSKEENRSVEEFLTDYNLKNSEENFISNSIQGIIDHIEDIDSIIESYLDNWSIERIPKMDLAILRVAIHELQYMKSIPPKVSINEAVEIAKKYSTEESYRFVNGVLGAFARKEIDNGSN